MSATGASNFIRFFQDKAPPVDMRVIMFNIVHSSVFFTLLIWRWVPLQASQSRATAPLARFFFPFDCSTLG